MKKAVMLLMAFSFVMIFSIAVVPATTEHLISFQGRATDDVGDPVASVDIRVRIYDAATAGTLVYDSSTDFNNATDSDGVFDVLLGSGSVALALDNTVKYYMEVDIDTEEVVGDAAGGRQEFWPGSSDHTHDHDTTYYTEAESDATFVNMNETNSVSSTMLVDGTITSADLFGTNCSDICTDAVGTGDITDVLSGVGTKGGAVSGSATIEFQCDDVNGLGVRCDGEVLDVFGLNAVDGSPTFAVYVDPEGDVGIGSLAPDSDLSVGGDGVTGAAIYGRGNEYGVFGDGDEYGGYFSNNDTSGYEYGVHGEVSGVGGGGNRYGGYFLASGTTTGYSYGVRSEGKDYGGFFLNNDTSGIEYGVSAWTTGSGGTTHYGGYFVAGGGTTNNYGVYATGTDYGVYGDGDTYGGYFTNNDTTGTDWGALGIANGAGGNTHFGGNFIANGATTNYGVGGNGTTCDFYAYGPGANFCPVSSIRWKRNIVEMDNALDKVLNLRGVYFDWDEEHGGQHDMGMIAEEVGEIVPEVVAYEADGEYAIGMDYGALTPLLVQAIKEQNELIDEQYELIEDQNDTITQLKELICLDHPDAEVCE